MLRFGDFRKIQVVHGAAILEQIQQDDAGKPQPVLRSAFDLGLILVVDLAFHDLLVFFQFGDAILRESAIAAAQEKTPSAGCATDSFAGGAEYGFSGPLGAGAPWAFTRSNSRRSSRASVARALLFHAQVAQLRVERLHLGLEAANQVGERADFRRRFRRFRSRRTG